MNHQSGGHVWNSITDSEEWTCDDEKDVLAGGAVQAELQGEGGGQRPGRPTELGEDPCGRQGRAGQAGCVEILGSLGAELRKVSAQGVAYLHSIKGGAPRAAVDKGLQRELQSRVSGEDSEGRSGQGDWER